MRSTTISAVLASIMVCGVATAQEEPPPNRVYMLHSSSAGPCPALDWHIGINDVSHTLSGIIAWGDNMQNLARANGTFNLGTRTFEMKAHEVGGQNRTAEITGHVRQDGYMIADITGPNISCHGITIPWYRTTGKAS